MGFIATVSIFFLLLAIALCDYLPKTNKLLYNRKSSPAEQWKRQQEPDKLKCPEKSKFIDLVLVLDTSGLVLDDFAQQRQLAIDLVEGIKVTWSNEMTQQLHIGLVSFAAEPLVEHPLHKGTAIGELLDTFRSVKFKGRNAQISVSHAVLMGLRQLQDFGREDALQVLVLISEGHGQESWSDVQRWPWPGVQSILNRLRLKEDVQLFATSANSNYTLDELALYTGDANSVFVGPKHHDFVSTLSTRLHTCLTESESGQKLHQLPLESLGEPILQRDTQPLLLKCPDKSNLVDLMLVLDTSKSVHRTTTPLFAQQRQIATDIVKGIQAAWSNKVSRQLKVGLVSFAAEPSMVLSLEDGSDIAEILNSIQYVNFKDKDGPLSISDGVELGLWELEKFGREDALQVIVLISDGYGRELWSKVQSFWKRLRSKESIQVLAVSASPDNNLDELALYTGDARRVFVGAKHHSFVSAFSNHVNTCLTKSVIK